MIDNKLIARKGAKKDGEWIIINGGLNGGLMAD
jgi:hypothetical protein